MMRFVFLITIWVRLHNAHAQLASPYYYDASTALYQEPLKRVFFFNPFGKPATSSLPSPGLSFQPTMTSLMKPLFTLSKPAPKPTSQHDYDLCITFRSNYKRFLAIASATPKAQLVAPKIKPLGSNCLCNAECQFGVKTSLCDRGRCSCPAGYKGFMGTLECQKLRIGDQCDSDGDCDAAVTNSFCNSERVCACPAGSRQTSDGNACQELLLGSFCTQNQECQAAVENSQCKNNECVCNANYVQTRDTRCVGCPGGVLNLVTQKCYYFRSQTDISWIEARDACREDGFELVTIESDAENRFVFDRVSDDTWIGLNDRGVEGTFVWSGGSQSGYRNWFGGQPDNFQNEEDCVMIGFTTPEGNYFGEKWNDLLCDASDVNEYVCTLEIDP